MSDTRCRKIRARGHAVKGSEKRFRRKRTRIIEIVVGFIKSTVIVCATPGVNGASQWWKSSQVPARNGALSDRMRRKAAV